MEHLLFWRKCSIFHNTFKYLFQRHQKLLLWSEGLTHLSRMEFLTDINWTSLFPILGLLVKFFHLYSKFKRNFCLKTVENLIRCRILLRLMWFCTVCRCPTKKDARLIWVKQPFERPKLVFKTNYRLPVMQARSTYIAEYF